MKADELGAKMMKLIIKLAEDYREGDIISSSDIETARKIITHANKLPVVHFAPRHSPVCGKLSSELSRTWPGFIQSVRPCKLCIKVGEADAPYSW